MKLLAKSDIAKGKAEEKRQAISEGLKLAKNVDALRETRTQEEASLEKFRKETLSKIQEEIVESTQKRGELVKEVAELEDKKLIALKPLDEEWNRVKEIGHRQDERENNLNEKELTLKVKESSLDSRKTDLELEEERVGELEKRVNNNYDSSLHELSKAKNVSEEAQKREKRVDEESKERLRLVSEKEESLEKREVALSLKAKTLEEMRVRLLKEERAITDKYNTLLRSQERLKKQNG